MEDKICFVIMGFGKKTDYASGETINLDKTYHNIIKPAVQDVGLKCVRADEIQDTGLIDRSMYALLVRADVVIADISTMNPNAIYELGVRHAVKPQSTIILRAESSTSIPFDINHTRVFSYKHLGEDIGVDEAKRMQDVLKEKLNYILSHSTADSPLYEYLHTMQPPCMDDTEYREIVGDLADKTESIFALTETAVKYMEEGRFEEAIRYWEKAREKYPNESYYTQQLALCTYKQETDDEHREIYLNDALRILEDIKETNDPETFGLRGAIYKRLCEHNGGNIAYLDRAIECYRKGYMLNYDYYTGENLAFCYNYKAFLLSDSEEKIYCKLSAQKIREEIFNILSQKLELEDITKIPNVKWILASYTICAMALDKQEKRQKYEEYFFQMADEWEKNTYMEQKEKLITLLKMCE